VSADGYVLDTSVLLRFFVGHDDPLQTAADELVESWLADRLQLVLLDLSVYELVNVSARRLHHDEERIRDDVRQLYRLRLPMVTLDEGLAADAGALVAATGLSGYDAAFLAAARMVGATLVTADDRLVALGGDAAVHLGSLAPH
jgi:predicted nucleic acid-binding protein